MTSAAQQSLVQMAADELETEGNAVLRKATRQREGRAPREIEGRRELEQVVRPVPLRPIAGDGPGGERREARRPSR